MSSMFDENDNMQVPIDQVLESMLERNKQLQLEVATLQVGNRMLREKLKELESNAAPQDIASIWNADQIVEAQSHD